MRSRFDVLVSYDVETLTPAGRRRLRKMAKVCEEYGQRVQYSVFELRVDDTILQEFLHKAVAVIDPASDSLRVYRLRGRREDVVRVFGRDGWIDFEGPLTV
jgi:CRISPR-associated protein Cas2